MRCVDHGFVFVGDGVVDTVERKPSLYPSHPTTLRPTEVPKRERCLDMLAGCHALAAALGWLHESAVSPRRYFPVFGTGPSFKSIQRGLCTAHWPGTAAGVSYPNGRCRVVGFALISGPSGNDLTCTILVLSPIRQVFRESQAGASVAGCTLGPT